MEHSETIDLIQSHRSIRAYTEQEVSESAIETIVASGRWAPSSHHVQAYSIIVIRDQEMKKQLAAYAGNQKYIETCPVFFVICADYYRLKYTSEKLGSPFAASELEQVIVGVVDAALVAENMLLAARSLGMGGVMIGGIRNDQEAVAKLLGLPDYTFPVMGLCVGYPAQQPEQKPRLPKQAVVHYEKYNTSVIEEALADYDEITERYYESRSEGKRQDKWSRQMANYFAKPNRPEVEEFIRKQGFLK
ncbi:oxygen-insensitive NADPH nitroreductase [Alkalihalobacillus oceani]|uniref:oxygen-insensitive NADPH nitroreductase n=1 Tax=Halalkalibacter oceani TaxID=1653776 RepID=UPI00203A8E94|nr:oxygen-insensitive NADPH nitroreductase [Halalkalibacter oceani]MCM3762176.1 oxygen-insensitive NADPH nitroreductase [Halalkalibacter oceani]